MNDLVTIQDCYAQLRMDSDTADDAWLSMAISAVSAAVTLWLKDVWRLYVQAVDSNGDPAFDSNGDPIPDIDSSGNNIVHPLVKLAVLIEIANQAIAREGQGDNAMPSADGYVLGRGATNLLAGLRKPTVA